MDSFFGRRIKHRWVLFLRGHLKEHVYKVPPRTIEDIEEGLQASVTTVDASRLMRVGENGVCFEMDGGRFEHLL